MWAEGSVSQYRCLRFSFGFRLPEHSGLQDWCLNARRFSRHCTSGRFDSWHAPRFSTSLRVSFGLPTVRSSRFFDKRSKIPRGLKRSFPFTYDRRQTALRFVQLPISTFGEVFLQKQCVFNYSGSCCNWVSEWIIKPSVFFRILNAHAVSP